MPELTSIFIPPLAFRGVNNNFPSSDCIDRQIVQVGQRSLAGDANLARENEKPKPNKNKNLNHGLGFFEFHGGSSLKPLTPHVEIELPPSEKGNQNHGLGYFLKCNSGLFTNRIWAICLAAGLAGCQLAAAGTKAS